MALVRGYEARFCPRCGSRGSRTLTGRCYTAVDKPVGHTHVTACVQCLAVPEEAFFVEPGSAH